MFEDRPLSDGPAPGRQCGQCTACCTVLAVYELNKPMRWACDHLGPGCCRRYDSRPESCREFHCLWLRGGIGDGESWRPDRCGVMFDSFVTKTASGPRYAAVELWKGAFDERAVAARLQELASKHEIELSYRDGRWRTIGEQ